MGDNNIIGIHNYCDRWCERCVFTSKCEVYESTSKLSSEQLDSDNAEFWDNLSSNFKQTIDLLKKEAEKRGIDFSEIENYEPSEEEQQNELRKRDFAKKHSVAVLSRKYSRLTLAFTKEDVDLTEKVRELVKQGHLGIKTSEEIGTTTADIGDAFEVVQWYMFFIEVKIQRALSGKFDEAEDPVDFDFPKDSDGSAKIALIAIEKSMAAYAKLHTYFPEQEDVILNALSILQQIKRGVELGFPKAYSFVRPGFDQ